MIDSIAADLPFVARTDTGNMDFWQPEAVEGYAAQNTLGKRYAADLHRYLQDVESPIIFGAVIRAMTSRGNYGGVEVGFCQYFGERLASDLHVADGRNRD